MTTTPFKIEIQGKTISLSTTPKSRLLNLTGTIFILLLLVGVSLWFYQKNSTVPYFFIIPIIFLLPKLFKASKNIALPDVYIFCQKTNTFSKNGQCLAKLSELSEFLIKVENSDPETYSLYFCQKDGSETILNPEHTESKKAVETLGKQLCKAFKVPLFQSSFLTGKELIWGKADLAESEITFLEELHSPSFLNRQKQKR